MPLLAAAAVAVVAASIGLVQAHPWASGHPAGHLGNTSAPSQPVQHPHGSSGHPKPTAPASKPPPVVDPSGFTHFAVSDMTFVGGGQGWALGTANCLLKRNGKVCIALVHSSDGGKSWHKVTNPPVDVAGVSAGCPVNHCATNIRFASPRIGYAFGPGVLVMTSNGGSTWTTLGGGADALEILSQNVIRVTTTTPGCAPPGCTYVIETASIGSNTWTQTATVGQDVDMATGVTLSRTGSSAYLDIYGRPAGGAQSAHSALYVSHNNGATWSDEGEACPQDQHGPDGGEVDSVGMTTASDGSITVACQPRGSSRLFTATSTDGGTHFTAGTRTYLASTSSTAPTVMWAVSASTIYLMADQVYRSANAGKSWSAVHQNSADPQAATWIGFEDNRNGHIASPASGGHGSTIWSTHNAGATWSSYTFR
jgi:photosystem II stability/assembly factor-like uncharacterized protein